MTVGLAIRVPDVGCVLACDSRVLAGYDIVSDDCDKFAVCGSALALVAGRDGGLLDAIKYARNRAEVVRCALAYTENKQLSWELLIWDRKDSSLWTLDQDGTMLGSGDVGTIGCGGPLVRGYLDGVKKPSNLPQAVAQARKALRISYRRNAACGGRQRVLSVSGKRGPITGL